MLFESIIIFSFSEEIIRRERIVNFFRRLDESKKRIETKISATNAIPIFILKEKK